MKKILFIIFVIGIVFSGCKSPYAPDIEETIEEIERRETSVVELTCSPNPILYYRGFTQKFVITLKEWVGISAKVDGIGITIRFDGFISPTHYSPSMISVKGYINLDDKQIPAGGKLEIECKLWLPLYVMPTEAEIVVNMTDVNRHVHQIIRRIALAIQ